MLKAPMINDVKRIISVDLGNHFFTVQNAGIPRDAASIQTLKKLLIKWQDTVANWAEP